MKKDKSDQDFLAKFDIDVNGKFDVSETENKDDYNLNKKNLSQYEMMSAIATSIHQMSLYTDRNKMNEFEEDAEKPYWLEYRPTNALKFKFKDNMLILMLTREITNPLKLTNHYNNEINVGIKDAVTSIKNKYKEITGKTLSLSEYSDVYEQVLPLSLNRQLRTYICMYKIGGIESNIELAEKERKEFLKTALDKAESMSLFKKNTKSK